MGLVPEQRMAGQEGSWVSAEIGGPEAVETAGARGFAMMEADLQQRRADLEIGAGHLDEVATNHQRSLANERERASYRRERVSDLLRSEERKTDELVAENAKKQAFIVAMVFFLGNSMTMADAAKLVMGEAELVGADPVAAVEVLKSAWAEAQAVIAKSFKVVPAPAQPAIALGGPGCGCPACRDFEAVLAAMPPPLSS